MFFVMRPVHSESRDRCVGFTPLHSLEIEGAFFGLTGVVCKEVSYAEGSVQVLYACTSRRRHTAQGRNRSYDSLQSDHQLTCYPPSRPLSETQQYSFASRSCQSARLFTVVVLIFVERLLSSENVLRIYTEAKHHPRPYRAKFALALHRVSSLLRNTTP